jgi:hypothetical protein
VDARRWGFFLAWFIVGGLYALSILGAMTIGIFVLPVALAATAFLATRRHARDGLPGLISGLGLPLFYVAFLNRDGPGTICTTTPTSQSCIDEWSPWPWLALGAALVLVGILVLVKTAPGITASRSKR